uniref:EMI domain-containing protein n=1 Tax=Electrophorus electricus TaxID=8005 RepID=A0A4W4EMC7_ELEEL
MTITVTRDSPVQRHWTLKTEPKVPFTQAFPLHGRNWCHYTVRRTVSCQTYNGTETLLQRRVQSCRWPGPCTSLISYRTVVRPSYRMSYRLVTALEWRCCPGFHGIDCKEGELTEPCLINSNGEAIPPASLTGVLFKMEREKLFLQPA